MDAVTQQLQVQSGWEAEAGNLPSFKNSLGNGACCPDVAIPPPPLLLVSEIASVGEASCDPQGFSVT